MNAGTFHRWVFTILAMLLLAGCGEPGGTAEQAASGESAESRLQQAWRERLDNLQVQGAGEVIRLLPDDVHGSRHQRFILRLESGQTLLVSHNIDLAPPIDGLRVGDTVAFFGEYEWNEKGGVIHWTHHDPAGKHADGWLRHQGRLYQ